MFEYVIDFKILTFFFLKFTAAAAKLKTFSPSKRKNTKHFSYYFKKWKVEEKKGKEIYLSKKTKIYFG